MGIVKVHTNVTPEKASATAKAALIPTIYASSTPGSIFGGNTLCSSEAPVRSTSPGFTSGAVLGRVASSLLTKADCPAEVLNAPPIVWKTVQYAG
jgi:ABC-type proline/glycine betaine transport system substrate-binding protein